jgi:hypothetical protein
MQIGPEAFVLRLSDGTRLQPEGSDEKAKVKEPALQSMNPLPGECGRGFVTFQTPTGERPALVLYEEQFVPREHHRLEGAGEALTPADGAARAFRKEIGKGCIGTSRETIVTTGAYHRFGDAKPGLSVGWVKATFDRSRERIDDASLDRRVGRCQGVRRDESAETGEWCPLVGRRGI